MQNKIMSQYLAEIKSLIDNITTVGSAIDQKDIILYTLNGFSQSYQSFKTTIHTNLNPINLDEFYSLLCSEETNLQVELLKDQT